MPRDEFVSEHASSNEEFQRVTKFFALVATLGIIASVLIFAFIPPKNGGRFVMLYPGLGITAVFCLMIGVRSYFVSKRKHQTVKVTEHGLQIKDKGLESNVFFEDIATVEEDEEFHQWCKSLTYSWWIQLVTDGGEKFTFAHGSQGNFAELRESIHTGMSQKRVPAIARRLLSGEKLKFGRVTMDQAQVVAGQTEIPWSTIRGVGIAPDGCVTFETADGWVNCNRTRNLIPNWDLIPSIAAHIQQKKAA